MKGIKKLTAALCAGALLLTTAACSTDVSWAAKNDKLTVPIGAYIYNLYASYQEAQSKVEDKGKPVLEQTIEEKGAEQWIRDMAMEATKKLMYLDERFREMNLTLSDEERKIMESNTNYAWTSNATKLEGYGIAKSSYQMVSTEYSAKFSKLFYALYGKGGKNEVSQADLKDHFEKNFTDYSFFYAPYTTYDSTTGSSNTMSDDDKKELREKFEGYAKEINDGDLTIEKAADQYKTDTESEQDVLQSETENLEESTYMQEMVDALKEMDAGEARFVETTSFAILLYKRDIKDKTSSYLADEESVKEVIADMKADEFGEAFNEEAAAYTNFTLNEGAINGQKIDKFVEPISSSSAASSDASGSSSEASSSEASSSEASSSAVSSD